MTRVWDSFTDWDLIKVASKETVMKIRFGGAVTSVIGLIVLLLLATVPIIFGQPDIIASHDERLRRLERSDASQDQKLISNDAFHAQMLSLNLDRRLTLVETNLTAIQWSLRILVVLLLPIAIETAIRVRDRWTKGS